MFQWSQSYANSLLSIQDGVKSASALEPTEMALHQCSASYDLYDHKQAI